MNTNYFPVRPGLPLLAFLMIVLAGCATVRPESCEHFEQARRSTRYDTVYRYSETDTKLAAKNFAAPRSSTTPVARWYTLRANRTQIGACEHLYLTKDLYLQRPEDSSLAFVEQRESYTADGRLVANKREDITNQLKRSGFYSASVPLPIPKEAPAGTYRIVTRLLAKSRNGGEKTIATTSVEFQVQQ